MSLLKKERIKADLTLLAVAIFWGSAFSAQRVAATHMGVYLFNGLRFMTGAIVLIPIAQFKRKTYTRKNTTVLLLAGILLFGGTSLQQIGLKTTTAGNAGFITGLYVVLVPILLSIFWRQLPHITIWIASLIAVIGLFLLSTGGTLNLAPGDAYVLAGSVMWALHVIVIGWLVRRVDVLQIAIPQYLVCGLLSLLVSLLTETEIVHDISVAWWTVAYTGIFSIALGYTLQAVGQRVAPPSDAAIILSTEAVFAAFSGWLILGETLTQLQLLGCGLILTGIILAQFNSFKAPNISAGIPKEHN